MLLALLFLGVQNLACQCPARAVHILAVSQAVGTAGAFRFWCVACALVHVTAARNRIVQQKTGLGVQVRSHRACEARATIGRGPRFEQPRRDLRSVTASPASYLPRPTSGWLGQLQPRYSFHTTAKRCVLNFDLPICNATSAS
jgi:hypothetical protein